MKHNSTAIKIKNNIRIHFYEYVVYLVWAVSWGSIFGSLYFSEIAGYIPCELCWWQRLLMYPLALLSTVAIIRKDYSTVPYYVMPFAVIGVIASAYHSLLQWGVIEHNVLNCSEGSAVSCSDPEIMWLGFITIPFLAFVSFATIAVFTGISIYLLRSATSTKNP
jgi:disulfide bond formation protein DsbB